MSAFLTLLNRDHGNFLHLLDAFEAQVKAVAHGERPSFHILKDVLAYFRGYPRQIHHPREELLLDLLTRRSPELYPEIHAIFASHRTLEGRLAIVEHALDDYEVNPMSNHREFVRVAEEFIIFERDHIAEENKHLIPYAIRHLTAADWEWADSAIGDIQDPLFGQAVLAPFVKLRESIFTTDSQVPHTAHGA